MNAATVETWRLIGTNDEPALHLRCQRRREGQARGAALYVHGATFPSALSLFFRFDGRSWADALNEAGFDAWGFDFAGYGASARYPAMNGDAFGAAPAGRADEAQRQLARVLRIVEPAAALDRKPLHLIAHSWGSLAALRCAGDASHRLASLVLFGPVAPRDAAPDVDAPPFPAWRLLTVWAQYRRFIADVPAGSAPVLADADIDAWARAYLDSDGGALARTPPAVQVPNGPAADIAELWSGRPAYDASRVNVPTLLVRGEWDSVFDAQDERRLAAALSSARVHTRVLPRGTHLMHLESGRHALHREVNEFLLAQTASLPEQPPIEGRAQP